MDLHPHYLCVFVKLYFIIIVPLVDSCRLYREQLGKNKLLLNAFTFQNKSNIFLPFHPNTCKFRKNGIMLSYSK